MNYLERNIKLAWKKRQLLGKPILKFTGEGCQGRNEFHWAGKVTGFETEQHGEDTWEMVVIEILIHNFSYGNNRDAKEKEVYKYPLSTSPYNLINDIQNVNGVWVLFAN